MTQFWLLVLFAYYGTSLAQELLQNHDFENGNSISPWYCKYCQAQIIHTDKYHGRSSVQVTNRHRSSSGITQTVTIQGGSNLKCNGYLKITTIPQGRMYTTVDFMANYEINGTPHYEGLYLNKYYQADGLWNEVGGDFHVPSGVNSVRIFVQVPDISVNYLFDYGSCQIIVPDAQWKTKANQRIENIRKGSITVSVASNEHVDTHGLTVQLKQTKSKFGFGTAFNARKVTDTSHKAYQNFLYNNFEWGVPESALKWGKMEKTRGHVDYDTGMNAVRALRSHGMKVRGHNMFWDDEKFVADWIKALSPSEVLKVMHKRVDDMMSYFKGTLEHWDVNNENLHGHAFENLTQHEDITTEIFNWMHAKDPSVKLFLNDYSVVAWRSSTTAYKNQGKSLKESGAQIYGMGVQSHFGDSNLNMDVIKYRLDKISEAGLPIWVTELTILDPNENAKASALDDVMTLFFSHPAVEGVLLWGFWDGAVHYPNVALATGSDVTPNAAGRKWQELFHNRFRSNVSKAFSGQSSVHGKVFKGEYQLIVKQNGKTIHTENIDIELETQAATLHLHGTANNIQVSHVAFG